MRLVHTLLWGTRVPNLVVLVILVYFPGYTPSTHLTLGYPGTKPGCFGHTRVFNRVPNLVVLVNTRVGTLLGYVPGYQTWWLWSCSGMYPVIPLVHTLLRGTRVPTLLVLVKTRLCTRVPTLLVLAKTRVCTRVPNLVVFFILGYVPGYTPRENTLLNTPLHIWSSYILGYIMCGTGDEIVGGPGWLC